MNEALVMWEWSIHQKVESHIHSGSIGNNSKDQDCIYLYVFLEFLKNLNEMFLTPLNVSLIELEEDGLDPIMHY